MKRLIRLAALVTLCVGVAVCASAQVAVTATSGISFAASTNDGTNPDGTPIVGGYRVDFQPGPGCAANGSVFLGKPTPVNGVITVQPFAAFATLPANCPYTISVTAVGQGPASATSVLSGSFERFVAVTPPPTPPPATGQGTMLTQADIINCTVMRTPLLGTGSNSTFYPKTFYYRDDGTRWIVQMTGDGHLVDYPSIAGVPCSTPLAAIPTAPYGTDYGTLDGIHSSTDQVPTKTSNAMYAGMHEDDDIRPRRLTVGTVGIYTGSFTENNQFTFEFDPVAGTKTLKSCWLLAGQPMTLTGSGGGKVPPYFTAANLTAGMDHYTGNGGPNGGVNAGVSLGMVAFAHAMPPDNVCHAFTAAELAARTPAQVTAGIVAVDYPTGPGTVLVIHPPNEVTDAAGHPLPQPTCAGTTQGIGCQITVAAFSPYPQRIAGCVTSSAAVYHETWDPSIYPPDGKRYCWVGPISGGAAWDWYVGATAADGSHKEAAVSTVSHSAGWVNTMVAATPAPTYAADGLNFNLGTGTMTLVNGCAHQGDCTTSHPYPGFTLFVETGDPTLPNADTDNMRNWGCAMVDTYNATTGATVFHWDSFCGPPMGANPQVPLIGGGVLDGCVYPHGMPGCSNVDNYLQFINPSQLAQVAQGTKDPSTVGLDEEFPLAQYMPQSGCTTCGTGGTIYTGVGTPMADGAHNQILIPMGTAAAGYGEQHLIYVFTVKP